MIAKSKAALVLFVLLTIATGTSLSAQSTRAFVSSLGSNSNDCSRARPCLTFSTAYANVPAGGEIIVLDPGSYGGLTISKSLTIIADNQFSGTRATLNTDGIIINISANDSVFIKSLTIRGNNEGNSGIHVLGGGSITIEDCSISSFVQAGVKVEGASLPQVFIRRTVIRDNNLNRNDGGGVVAGAGSVLLEDVSLQNNSTGLRVQSGKAVIGRGSISANQVAGVSSTGSISISDTIIFSNQTGISSSGSASISNATIAGNQTGISTTGKMAISRTTIAQNSIGLRVSGGSTQISDDQITGNGTGVLVSGGTLGSYRNNQIFGNDTNGTPNGIITSM